MCRHTTDYRPGVYSPTFLVELKEMAFSKCFTAESQRAASANVIMLLSGEPVHICWQREEVNQAKDLSIYIPFWSKKGPKVLIQLEIIPTYCSFDSFSSSLDNSLIPDSSQQNTPRAATGQLKGGQLTNNCLSHLLALRTAAHIWRGKKRRSLSDNYLYLPRITLPLS